MNRLIQRIQSYLAFPQEANEKIDDLLIELRGRGLNFTIHSIDEDGQKYFYAESVNYRRGHISATGQTTKELEAELKDDIFTAFEVPVRNSNPSLIVFNPPLPIDQAVLAKTKIYATT